MLEAIQTELNQGVRKLAENSLIKKLNEQGTTILLVEQNAKMALKISDRAYVLETGKISLEGEAKKLAQNSRIKQAYLGA